MSGQFPDQYKAPDKVSCTISDPGDSRTLLSPVSDVHRPLPKSSALPTKSFCQVAGLNMLKFSLGTSRYCLSVGWIIFKKKSQKTFIMLIAHVATLPRTLQIRQARYGKIHDFVVCNKRVSPHIRAV